MTRTPGLLFLFFGFELELSTLISFSSSTLLPSIFRFFSFVGADTLALELGLGATAIVAKFLMGYFRRTRKTVEIERFITWNRDFWRDDGEFSNYSFGNEGGKILEFLGI